MTSKFRKSPKQAAALTAAALMIFTISAGSANAFGTSAGGYVKAVASYAATAAPQAPAAKGSDPLHIVAVGDSLTVGYEYGMGVTSVPYGYVDRVYEQALYHGRADLKNYGVLGLKSPGLSGFLKAAAEGKSVTAEEIQVNDLTDDANRFNAGVVAKSAQMAADLKTADLVTLTIGGNDFTPIFEEIKSKNLPADELKTKLDAMLADYNPQLEASLRTILSLNPKATVVFADQYLPAPKPSTLNKAITQEQYDVLTAAVSQLKGQDEALAAKLTQEGYDVRAVDVSAPFKDKELFYTYILKGDIHPKQDGYDAMGRAFAKGIWGSYRDPGALAIGTPLRVVVNGSSLKGANKPVLKNNTTFLPMRDIATALHASLAWDNKTRTATIKSGDKQVAFTIGANTMKVNGQSVPLETPAYLQQVGSNSVTYLPLAALSKGLGFQVEYRKPIVTVFINS
ncbi:stalk domain-containing protein [Paenibacillus sp. R14(2021)]|uniref:stalk domain-containing protein n=1 Tax=Paenibacillus sp. R14(2021) TaxID=2859228 RepID=UPI001C6134A3|nr:stalk domain-containing protein [Paenibacillus sp. R14(2021)]